MISPDPASLYQALGRLIAAIAATRSEADIYRVVARFLPTLIPADRVSVALIPPGSCEFEIFALEGSIADPPLGTRFPLDDSNNVSLTLREGKAHLADVKQVEKLGPLAARQIQQVMSAPFFLGGQVLGSVNVASCHVANYGPAELELLTQVASLIGTNLERLRLSQETQRAMARQRSYAARLETLNEMGRQLSSAMTEQEAFNVVAEAIEGVLAADRVSYVLPEPDGESCKIWALSGNAAIPKSACLPLKGSSIGAVIESNQAILFEDLATSPYPEHAKLHGDGLCMACSVPIQTGGQAIGVLNAAVVKPWDSLDEARTLLHALGRFMGTTLERIQAQKDVSATVRQLEHQASHDALTGLPNRFRLGEALTEAIEAAQLQQQSLAILFVDLDRFKEVNDVLSHSVGDELLCAVADRMVQQLGPSALVSRMGGDEFVVLLPQHQQGDASRIATRLLEHLRTPFRVAGHQIYVGGSIGISLFPEHGQNGTDLLKHADVAMYAAKRSGRDNCQVYDEQMSQQLEARLLLEHDLKLALERKELFLLFQPQYELRSNRMVGIEALVRWSHPTRGIVSPGVFIVIAEECGFIGDLTAWVLRESLVALRSLRELHAELYVSVNISAQELLTPLVLTQHIETALLQAELPGEALELELTERVFLDYPETASQVLETWNQQGIRLAIDDFGTGFSSLNYLLNLPMDTLKIDRSFVQSIQSHERKQGVVKTILALGKSLGATCVAEGVEELEQLEFLRELGCQKVQGFFLARPMPLEQLAQLLEQDVADALESNGLKLQVA